MKTNKSFALSPVLLIILGVIIIGGIAYYTGTKNSSVPQNAIKNNNYSSTTVPSSLPTPYISAQSGWPPVIQNSSTPYSCTQGSYIPIEITEKTINGKNYCIKIESEGTAGHIYRTYTYTTKSSIGNSTATTNFTLGYVDCGVYDGPQHAQCQTAQSNFNLDVIIDNYNNL